MNFAWHTNNFDSSRVFRYVSLSRATVLLIKIYVLYLECSIENVYGWREIVVG